jgi:isocitrate dehydrogenase kinase/phosphatase
MAIKNLDPACPAWQIARFILAGFNQHYRRFYRESRKAKSQFEQQKWQAQQHSQIARIGFYDERVAICVAQLQARLPQMGLLIDTHARTEKNQERKEHGGQDVVSCGRLWPQVKQHYVNLLMAHAQPELAETFFNSVTCQLLHRQYFHNRFIFVRPAISTEYVDNQGAANKWNELTYRAYYPMASVLLPDALGMDAKNGSEVVSEIGHSALAMALKEAVLAFDLACPFQNLDRDIDQVVAKWPQYADAEQWRANFQIQFLSSLFFRNKGAYAVGRLINGVKQEACALAFLHEPDGKLRIDAVLMGEDALSVLFSFTRAYFLVDTRLPCAYVQFLHTLMPGKPRAELYNALGLAKQGKTLFYRDFLLHLRHSTDSFRLAPGIKGMVMLVFDLPSFPFVFKIIKDRYPPQKETTRAQIQAKYWLVKQHDRVGRMADTWEYSNVAFPLARFSPELLAEIEEWAPSQIEKTVAGQQTEVVIKHLYIERRMIPLNIYLQSALMRSQSDKAQEQAKGLYQLERAVSEYGKAIKELVAANIFPGDMLWKNFGVTRYGKVVFYDYDEIEYLTDCRFRRVPPPRCEEDEMSSEPWYTVGPQDVFPETFASFLLTHPQVKDLFMREHCDLLEPAFWLDQQARIRAGQWSDVYPYDASCRLAAL